MSKNDILKLEALLAVIYELDAKLEALEAKVTDIDTRLKSKES